MRIPKYFYDPDGTGGGGNGDPDPDPKSKGAVADDTIKAVADAIKQAVESGRSTPPAPISVAPVDDRAAKVRDLEAEAVKVAEQADALFAEGKGTQATAILKQFDQKVARTLATPTDNDPVIKTAVALGKRVAQVAHPDVMNRWGSEVERAVAAMSPEERISPDAWDKAVTTVKANHFQELLDEATNARVEEARKSFVPPPSSSGRVNRVLKGKAAELSEEQLAAADACGVTPEEYVTQIDREAAYDRLPAKVRGPGAGYPIIDDQGAQRVAPGKF